MLQLTIPATEEWDESKEEFITFPEKTIALEHSLVSISKWESKWHKAFLTNKEKSVEEIRDYVRCMTLTQNVDPNLYYCLSSENYKAINEYIDNPMSATHFNVEQQNGPGSRETITSELIYYWMVAYRIPVEFQKWHLNRLLTLIRICNLKNSEPKKRSPNDILRSNAALNAARRKQLNTRG